jgi:hypothetical protein
MLGGGAFFLQRILQSFAMKSGSARLTSGNLMRKEKFAEGAKTRSVKSPSFMVRALSSRPELKETESA